MPETEYRTKSVAYLQETYNLADGERQKQQQQKQQQQKNTELER